jgi:hypothetical protein
MSDQAGRPASRRSGEPVGGPADWVTLVAALEKLHFKRHDYLTNGQRLVRVEMILPDGDVLIEDAWSGAEEHMPAIALQEWRVVTRNARRKAA